MGVHRSPSLAAGMGWSRIGGRGAFESRVYRQETRMKIATYNVNGIGARLPVLLQWLERSRPDVACLQELKAPDERFPAAALREAGYEAVWHGQKAWNGVAGVVARDGRFVLFR